MKYLVEVKYTNPAHEHVSLRRRVDTINRVVEARNEDEAINRVANQQRALGFLVREAKVLEEAVSFGRSGGVMHYDPKTEKSEKPAKGVSALDKDGNLVGHYPDLATAKKMKPGHTYQTSKGVAKEEVEQTDEALLPKQQVVADKLKASELAANKEKAGYKFGKSLRAAKVAAKMKKEEVEQIDELKKSTLASYVNKAANQVRAKTGIAASFETQGARKRDPENKETYMSLAKDYRTGAKKRLTGIEKATAKLAKEEVEYIEEKLTAADPASEWIKDFVASDNPKFAGKSKKERINMALGAYYAAKKSKNEESEKKYNEKEVKNAEKKQDKKKGSLNKINVEPEMEPGKPNA